MRIDYTNATGDFAHSLKQRDYAIWKYEQLKSLCSVPLEQHKIKYPRILIRFLAHPILTELFPKLYQDNKKIISTPILEMFDEVSLAVLFMDDGYKATSGGYNIATHCFDAESLKRLADCFYCKWKINVSYHKGKVLYVPVKSAEVFKKLIAGNIHTTMKYKLHT